MTINRLMSPFEWLLLTTLAMLWGGTFFFSEVALEEVGPLALVLGRVSFAALALLAVVYVSGNCMRAAWPVGCRSWSWACSTT